MSNKRQQTNNEIEISSIKKCLVASVVLEQSGLEILDASKQELRQRINRLISAAKSVQSYFENFPGAAPKYKEIFRSQFLSGNIVLYGEILSTIHGLTEESLEHVLESLRTYVSSAEEVVEESGETLKS